MDDKKNEDYGIKMPEIEMRSFSGRSSPSQRDPFLSSRSGSGKVGGIPFPVSNITNSPGISILAYCLASISMTVTNKYCVSGANWNLNFFYLAIQSVVCIIAIMICKQLGLITNLAPFDAKKAKTWFPISLLLVGMIYTSTKALQFLSVPVYTIFKNLTIIVIAYGEVLWFGGSVTASALFSFGLMVLSSVVAAWADIQHALYGSSGQTAEAAAALSTLNAGYAWMGMNVFCTAAYVLSMRKVIKKMNFKDWDTMFYNNLLTIPVLFLCSMLFEDWTSENIIKNFPVESRNNLILGMIYSGLATIFISYCSAWCIRVTSSTTYSMVGALNKLPIAVSGLVFFAAPVTFGSVSAIIIGFVSGIVYAWAKVRQTQMAKMTLPTTQPVMSASSQSSRDAASSDALRHNPKLIRTMSTIEPPPPKSEASLSFTQGLLLGQLSIVILIGAFIKFFIFGDPPSPDVTAALRATERRSRTLAHKRSLLTLRGSTSRHQSQTLNRKRSSVLRNPPPLTTNTILSKTYYNVDSHQPESLDWFNVLIAQTIAQFRSDAQQDDAILTSLTKALNGSSRPDFLDEITVTELSLGEDFPIFSNCRVIPVDEDGLSVGTGGGGGSAGREHGRLQARMDIDLSDFITLALETRLQLNYPKPLVAILPVALAVSVVRFSGTLSISFIPGSSHNSSPTTLAFSFLDDYRLDLSIRSLVGSRSRLQDVPKIAQLVEARLHTWFDERCVEPRFQQIELPSLWPRKKNTRGGEDGGSEPSSISRAKGHNIERDLREEARKEVEAETRARGEADRIEADGLRWRRRARVEGGYAMPGSMPMT